MYCIKCGAENENNARFCVECGAKLQNVHMGRENVVTEKKVTEKLPYINKMEEVTKKSQKESRRKIKIVPIIILLVLVAAVVVFPKFIMSGQAEKKILKEFVEAEMTGDTEKLIDILPEEVLEAARTEGGMSRNELAEEMRKQFDSVIGTLESTYGEDWKYSYKINSIKKVSQEDLEDIKDMYSDELEMELDISEVKTAKVEVNVSGNDLDNTLTLDVNLLKIKNKWYLDFASLAALAWNY